MSYLARHMYFLLCFVVVVGCQSAEPPAPAPIAAIPPTPLASVNLPATPAKATSSGPHTPDLAEPKVRATQVAEFKPPFPERNELFEAPKRAQSTVRRDDEQGQSVELKGFINVDQPRVVLSIDGVISPIPEGGEKYGVQVISIQPPKAVLQRGRSRWTATLE
jgi:hypothetical protein